jgi:hypothetical protein
LHDGHLWISEVWDGFEQKVRVGYEVGIENGDEFTFGGL